MGPVELIKTELVGYTQSFFLCVCRLEEFRNAKFQSSILQFEESRCYSKRNKWAIIRKSWWQTQLLFFHIKFFPFLLLLGGTRI